MALRSVAFPGFLQMVTPRLSFVSPSIQYRTSTFLSSYFLRPFPSLLSISISAVVPLNFPSLLSDIWESVLRAVPKKKTSHRKKRQRFLAGKALKDVTSLNKCSACGNVKRAHLLCPYCVREIRDIWLGKSKPKEAIEA